MKEDKVDHREEALKAKETVRKEVKKSEPAEENAMEENPTDVLEKAMEVLGPAAEEMMQQVADTFGISVEELSQMMEELNMSTVDIMNPDKLGELLLAVGGAEDSMELLTNEELYMDFKTLIGRQALQLDEISKDLHVSTEDLQQLIEQVNLSETTATEPVNEMQSAPLIEVTVENEDTVEVTDLNGEGQNFSIAQQNPEEGMKVSEPKAETGREDGKSSDDNKGQMSNLLLQNLKLESTQSGSAQAVAESSSVWDTDTQDIMNQIMDYMKIQVKPGVSDLEMQLHPASLGTLQVHVSAKGGVVTANFVTQNEAVKAALESQMIQLKESFAEQGVKVEAIEVTVQTHQFESNLEQGRGRNQEETGQKSRTRRIHLDASLGMDETEEMSEEDALAAEIMTANGNTGDYTA